MKTNEQIRFHLTGDDGKARKRCETCGGSGEYEVDHGAPCDGEYTEQIELRQCDCDGGWVYDELREAAKKN